MCTSVSVRIDTQYAGARTAPRLQHQTGSNLLRDDSEVQFRVQFRNFHGSPLFHKEELTLQRIQQCQLRIQLHFTHTVPKLAVYATLAL